MRALLTALFALTAISTPFAANIAVLDAQQVINNTNAAKRAVENLTKEREAAQKKVEELETPLIQKREDLEAKKSVLSEEDFMAEQANLRNEIRAFRLEAQTIQEALERKNLTYRKEISDVVKEVVADYSKEKGYDVVLPKALLFYATDAADISDDILKRANNKLDQ